MKRRVHIRRRLLIVILVALGCSFSALPASAFLFQQQDSVRQDTTVVEPYTPSKTPTYRPQYRFGDPFSNRTSQSPLLLNDPSQLDFRVDFDTGGVNYSIYEKLSEVNFRPATSMSFGEFDRYTTNQINRQYWKDRSAGLDGESAVSGRRLIPKLFINPVFDRIFGGSYIDIQPTGFANLDFGGRWQFVDNPQVPQRQRRNGGFNFNMQLSTNVVGKIGEKLAVTFNFDNNNTFDFQNQLKVEYTGYEEDIIKKIEIGNVSMPVQNSLITGAQSLFGVKTQLQFGKLFVTTIASRQQGRSEVITVGGGQGITNNTSGRGSGQSAGDNINIRASEYDENRHFFLGHYFRDNYENWHSNLPQINSGVNVPAGSVEVYSINRNNDTRTTRNFVALMDLGESSPDHVFRNGNTLVGNLSSKPQTSNTANQLFANLRDRSRDPADLRMYLNDQGLEESTDYVIINTARKLDPSEYVVNEQLGYITLLRRLQNDEVLAVSYQYNAGRENFQVGELQNNYGSRPDDDAIILKMLRPNQIDTEIPTWDLMMKNIYNLRTTQVQEDGFSLRVHYRDDATGQDNPSLHLGRRTKDQPLIELMGLDQLNRNGDRQRDGNFDFVPGVTIDTRNGNIIFPVLEPFGSNLASFFDPQTEANLIDQFVYDTLYRTTKANAELVSSLNKYVLLGSSSGSISNVIPLNGFNIAPGSVTVTAGGTLLTEGLHYDVDYNLGQVRIRDDAILQSGKAISVAYEKADLFNFQTRWLTGAHFDYRISDNFNLGATVLRLNERPGGISRFAIGDEPTRNTKYGFNINWQDESIFLTKLVDALPLVSTKEPSNITFSAEVAQLVPGTSNIVQGSGTSYIDDFENATTPINLGTWPAWRLSATPRGRFGDFAISDRTINDRRAKLAWYTIDNSIFYRAIGNNRPDNIDEDDLRNHYVRAILPQEIFTQRDRTLVTTNEPIFDLAFYPEERGPYNFNPMAVPSGSDHAEFTLPDAPRNWGGISRAITTNVDFIATNVEYLEFWLLDPFIDSGDNGGVNDGNSVRNFATGEGGSLFFNLGSVSEDLMRDGRHAFENGLPDDGSAENTTTTTWGRVTDSQFLTNAFVNDGSARANQDVGLDGLTDDAERIPENYSDGGPDALFTNASVEDPAGDNFQYYLGSNLDARDAQILERYKNFNGLDGNSPVSSGGSFTPASTQFPDNEDLNNDNTISDLEEYYEYHVPLTKGNFTVGENYIIDQVSTVEGANWYLFRIPVQDPKNFHDVVGTPTFNNIKYVRMYMTGFRQPVVLRMAKFQLVGSQWRKSREALNDLGLNEVPETTTSDFDVSVVNIEENGGPGEGIPYVIPPGLNRDRDNTTALNRQVNEQSLQLCIEDLADRDSRAVYKTNLNYDLINYGRIKMFLHAQAHRTSFIPEDELVGFLRLGSDENENFYEIAVPLKITPGLLTDVTGDDLRRAVWPLENEIDVSVNEILGLKSERNRRQLDSDIPYTQPTNDGRFQITVKGNPDISNITTMLIGVRNPGSEDRQAHSVCLWANELRVTDFDTRKGWAANARLSVKLADLGTVSASTRYTSTGYGTIQQKISERTRAESIQYDISTSLNVDKFLWPEKTGLKIPMFASYEQSRITPQFDPLDPDTPLEASLESFSTEEERNEYKRLVEDRRTSRSLNFTNVRKQKVNPDAGSNIYDIENFTFSYAYSDIVSSSVSQASFIQKTVSGGVSYNYSPPSFSIEPFAKAKWTESPYLKLIKDINFSPIPSNLSFRADLNRSFRQTQLFNADLTTEGVDPFYERLFTFTRSYNLRWSLFKGLSFDYAARANAVIDEPDDRIEGDIDTRLERQFIWDQIASFGRMKNFSQDVSANYKLPLDKFPITDWMSADYRYSVGYNWTAGFVNRQDGFSNAPPNADDPDFFGNFISNNRSQALTGKFDLVKLYNKSKYLKKVNASSRPRSGSRSRSNASRRVQNDDEEEEKGDNKAANGFVRLLMSLRSVNVTYNVREGTTLPGFLPNLYLFGLDSGFNAPGWEFLLGSQNASIKRRAANSGWLTRNAALTNPFEQTLTTDLTVSADIEPFKDFKIKLDAKRTNSADYQEIFSLNEETDRFEAFSPSRGGSYNISFLSINTAFEKQSDNESAAFEQFARNIEIMRTRLNQQAENLGIEGRYDTLAQDVLVPAFIAAYTEQDANTARTAPLPKIPLPNWRLDYAGLSKIPALSEVFSSINVTHGYRSVFSISNYTNNIFYNQGVSLENNILDYPIANQPDPSDSTRLLPVYNIQQVTIAEQFTPLIGINVRTKTNFTTRFELKRDRNLSLNVSNAQVTETRNNEVSFDLGYVKDKLKLPWKARGRTITIENEVTFRMNMSIRNALTIQRNLEGENTITNGNKNFQMRPTIGYKLNDQLDLTMYFERTITNPQVGSFRRATTAFGIQTRLSFAQ